MDRSGEVRRSDLDWMRIALAVAALLLTASRPFGTMPWLLRDPAGSPIFDRVADTLELAAAPMFCLVSGGAAVCALRSQGAASFVVSKVLRLFVPLVSGTLLFAPLQHCFAGRSAGVPELHPWYLLVLFLSCLLLLPAFIALGTPSGRRLTARLSGVLRSPCLLAAVGFLPAAANAVPGTGTHSVLSVFGGWNPLLYPVMVALGFILFSEPGLQALAVRQRHGLAAAAALCAAVLLVPAAAARVPVIALPALRGFAAWVLCAAILGYGLSLLRSARPLPPSLNERILPAFVLCRPVTLALAWALSGWPAGAGGKFSLLAAALLAALVALTEAVRRVGILRFLFGLSSGGKHI